jgi:tetratricopeptide (TPR) repeat protein
MGVVSWNEINHYFIEAYCNAARAEVDMRAATNALESLRETVASIPSTVSIFDAWAAFDLQIGVAEPERFMPILVKLRKEFKKIAIQREIFRLQRAFDRDETEGCKQWQDAYMGSFNLFGWRSEFALEITEHALRVTPFPDWSLKRIRQSVKLVDQGRWAETYDWFLFLSKQDLPIEQRANMLATAAEIQLYHFLQPTKAKTLLEEAKELAANADRVRVVWGEYWLQVNQPEEARPYFEPLISETPNIVDGYVYLGDYFDAIGETSRAEELYQQAVNNVPGMVDGYRRLMRLYGRPAWFKDHQNDLLQLHTRCLGVDEDQSYSYVSLGMIYKDNQLYDQAQQQFEKAIELDPESILAHIWQGNNYLDLVMSSDHPEQQTQYYDQAQACFGKVIEIAPQALDGHWGILRLEYQRSEWQAALDASEHCLKLQPEWESYVLVGRANIYQQMGRYDDAEKDILRSLELEPDNPGALDQLSNLADTYKLSDAPQPSLRALDALKKYKKDLEEYNYQNRIGNLHFYFTEYDQAAQRYRLALEENPGDDVLHSNLALALANLKAPGKRLGELREAIHYLKRSIELNPEDSEYPPRLEALKLEQAYIRTYGEKAVAFSPVVPGIRIKVHDAIWADVLADDQINLSSATLENITAMRQRLLDRYGVGLPSILYSALDSSDDSPGKYEIHFQEIYYDHNYVEAGNRFAHLKVSPDEDPDTYTNPIPYGQWIANDDEIDATHKDQVHCYMTVSEYIIFHLERLVADHLENLVGFQEIVRLLNQCDEETSKAILEKNDELLRYWQVMIKLLGERTPLKNIQEISQAYLAIRKETEKISEIAQRLMQQFQPV